MGGVWVSVPDLTRGAHRRTANDQTSRHALSNRSWLRYHPPHTHSRESNGAGFIIRMQPHFTVLARNHPLPGKGGDAADAAVRFHAIQRRSFGYGFDA